MAYATREALQAHMDAGIRRAIAFFGVAAAVVLLTLTFDALLALRTGAEMGAFLVIGLALAGRRAPHRNLRRPELQTALREAGVPLVRLAAAETTAEAGEVLRERLYWHAARVGLAAIGFWLAAALLWLAR